jgi:hypothetical protein
MRKISLLPVVLITVMTVFGIALINYSQTQIGLATGLGPWGLLPFTFGILFVSWGPLLLLALVLRPFAKRLSILEHEQRVACRS